MLHLLLAVQTSSHLLVSLDETFEFFLKAVVLVVEVGHVLVQSVDFGLQFNLVLAHLVGVVLQAVDLVADALLVLLKLLEVNGVLVKFKLGVLALNVFVLIGLEKLLLGVLVLLVLVLIVSQLCVELV